MIRAARLRQGFLVSCFLAMAAVTRAVSYVPVTDASMVDRSPIVVMGRAADFALGDSLTTYQVSVERVLKGALSLKTITVAVPGGEHFLVPGMPRLSPGQRVILFLMPYPDGSFRIMELMLGAFKERQVLGSVETRAVRDLADSLSVGGSQPEPVRDFEAFASWIEARAQGRAESTNYVRAAAALAAPDAPFTLILNPPTRFVEFDTGGTVQWFLRPGGSTLTAGGATVFQTAMNAYNAQPNTIFKFTYGGTNPNLGGMNVSDDLNAMLINDPFGDIPGSFTCGGGGVLAIGGPHYLSLGQIYKGIPHDTTVEGDIVMQDGADCYFKGFGEAAGAQVLAHEMGHVVGLGHSCGGDVPACVSGSAQDDALMRATQHNDPRGATFGSDDVNGLVRLYERVGAPTLPLLSIDNPSQAEGNTGTTLMAFTVTLSAPPAGVVSVNFATVPFTAAIVSDYTSRSGTITFAAGQTTRHILVQVTGDIDPEGNDSFLVVLSNPVGANIAYGTGRATILNDDVPGAASPTNQYRLYSPVTLEHLYTTDQNEYNVLGSQAGIWLQEGVGYKMLSSAGSFSATLPVPFYRLYHSPTRQHHWTTDANEVMTLAAFSDWSYEGIIGFLLPTQTGSAIPLYRLVYPAFGIHLWTTDANEKLVLTTQRGWTDEGIPGYVIP